MNQSVLLDLFRQQLLTSSWSLWSRDVPAEWRLTTTFSCLVKTVGTISLPS